MSSFEDIVYTRNGEIAYQEIEGKMLLLNPKKLGVHELNETATFLWKQLEKSQSLLTLTDQLCHEYRVDPKQAQQDIGEIIKVFLEQGLIA